MPAWTFRQYVSPYGERVFLDWYQAQPQAAQNALRNALLILRAHPNWLSSKCDYYKALDPPHVPIGEVIFGVRDDKLRKTIQYRAFGFREDSKRYFVFFGGCRKHGRDVIPLTAYDDARMHYDHYAKRLGTLDRHDIV